MEETVYNDSSSSSSSSDDENQAPSFYFTDEESDDESQHTYPVSQKTNETAGQSEMSGAHAGSINIIHKLFNRERFGNFNGSNRVCKSEPKPFISVPLRLRVCLKDLIGSIENQRQIYMGLSACGQFLLSFTISSMDLANLSSLSFNNTFKYTLYFWVYKPGEPLKTYYTRCLFDDHGVDNTKDVTMVQWRNCDANILVVHGKALDDGEDSYISYLRVPKLGCQDCIKIRETYTDGLTSNFCLKCNLTVHTKYSTMESDRKFNPYLNLLCSDRIFIVSNGFMHFVSIAIDNPPPPPPPVILMPSVPNLFNRTVSPCLISPSSSTTSTLATRTPPDLLSSFEPFHLFQDELNNSSENSNAETLAKKPSDADAEPAGATSTKTKQSENYLRPYISPTKRFYTSNSRNVSHATSNTVTDNGNVTTEVQNSPKTSRLSLVKHRDRKSRIFTKTFRNGILSVDMQGPGLPSTSSSSLSGDKSSAYEFCEENEKCEKISILRKRRLAEKKYEFSEDNTENIVPFTKTRKSHSLTTAANNSSPRTTYSLSFSPCSSPTYSPFASHASPSSNHCSSPISSLQQGFRSPQSCSSPLYMASMRSPSRNSNPSGTLNSLSFPSPSTGSSWSQLSLATQQMLSYKPLGALSPIQVSLTKRNYLDLNCMSPNGNVIEVNLQGEAFAEKPICVKQLKRRYVEEDDAATVITSEEDDCISPGYHTSLPLEVHGGGYSAMHMISKNSYAQLNCPSVVVTQHSFDLETFTYHVISTLCQKNQKTYEIFYDWACDVVTICPMTKTATCLLFAHFSAKDQVTATTHISCYNCSRKIDCAFHRKEYECRILFAWFMEVNEWEVLDYGEMTDLESADVLYHRPQFSLSRHTLSTCLKRQVNEMRKSVETFYQYEKHLRVLECNLKKTKDAIIDLDNMVEFHLRKIRTPSH